MSRSLFLLVLGAISVAFVACEKKDDNKVQVEPAKEASAPADTHAHNAPAHAADAHTAAPATDAHAAAPVADAHAAPAAEATPAAPIMPAPAK